LGGGATLYNVDQKNGATFFLRLVTLEVEIRSAPNLTLINAISFLKKHNRNLFESTLERRVTLSSERQ